MARGEAAWKSKNRDPAAVSGIVVADLWPQWGQYGQYGQYNDLVIGHTSGAPGGSDAWCQQGHTYRGTDGEICGGDNWGATAVEVWYPR